MFFDQVPAGRPDAVFGLGAAFKKDPRPNKVDLTVGIYKNERLEAELFPVVKEAKAKVLGEDFLADYLPMDGLPEFSDQLGTLMLGKSLWPGEAARVYGAESVGGTGALRVGAEFLRREVGKKICIPDPTWPNHKQIFERAGFEVGTYPYYEKRVFDCEKACRKLKELPEKTVVLFHASCHNPTGCDPTEEDWKRLSEICLKKKLLPFFDFAYQGLGEGLEQDAQGVRWFVQQGHEMGIAYSCSKNFSLYCQRVGALFFIGKDAAAKARIGSQVKQTIRAMYSNPPAHGARIVTHILTHATLREQWKKELESARKRVVSIRKELVTRLGKERFHYLLRSVGLFAYLDLTKAQVEKLIQQYGVYLLQDGRINVAGLTKNNVEYVAESILSVSRS